MGLNIPIVDFRDYFSEDPKCVQNFVHTIGDALVDTGFFVLGHHGVDLTLIRKAYQVSKAFFALPQDRKQLYEIPGLKGQRGYTSYGREHAKNSTHSDLKEFWHVGRDPSKFRVETANYPANIWPSDEPNFKDTFEELYRQLDRCSSKLLEACAIFLNEAPTRFSSMTEHGNSILRVIHYPPILQETSAVRAAAHEDINLITLLCEATDAGLELRTHDGQWHPIHSLKGQIVVDSGDMLQNLSNGIFKSTTHRVVNPPNLSTSRYSMPFFCHPRPECDLSPLASCVSQRAHKQHYPNITAAEYLHKRLQEIGLSK